MLNKYLYIYSVKRKTNPSLEDIFCFLFFFSEEKYGCPLLTKIFL